MFDHCGVLLQVDLGKHYSSAETERLVAVYNKPKIFYAYLPSSRRSSHHGQAMVGVLKRDGLTLRLFSVKE
jgi:hypothetical protein